MVAPPGERLFIAMVGSAFIFLVVVLLVWAVIGAVRNPDAAAFVAGMGAVVAAIAVVIYRLLRGVEL